MYALNVYCHACDVFYLFESVRYWIEETNLLSMVFLTNIIYNIGKKINIYGIYFVNLNFFLEKSSECEKLNLQPKINYIQYLADSTDNMISKRNTLKLLTVKLIAMILTD